MKKLFLSLLFCSLFAFSVMAQKQEHFFYKEVSEWLILGEKDYEKKLLVCSMEKGIKGKNLIDFGYTFVEDYFYIVISSENINLRNFPENKTAEARMSLRMPNGKIESAPAGFVKLGDNAVMFPHIIPEAFFPYFLNALTLSIELPDNRGKTEISIAGIQESFKELGDCAEKAIKIKTTKEQKL